MDVTSGGSWLAAAAAPRGASEGIASSWLLTFTEREKEERKASTLTSCEGREERSDERKKVVSAQAKRELFLVFLNSLVALPHLTTSIPSFRSRKNLSHDGEGRLWDAELVRVQVAILGPLHGLNIPVSCIEFHVPPIRSELDSQVASRGCNALYICFGGVGG